MGNLPPKFKKVFEKYGKVPKSLLANTEMVKAILEGRKTQFRGIVKTPHCDFRFDRNEEDMDGNLTDNILMYDNKKDKYLTVKPKYQEGQILWVRESFVRGKSEADCSGSHIVTFYKADGDIDWVNGDLESVNTPWKPSVLMPKEYARIFLKIKNVKVERLQDISWEDARSEGGKAKYNRDDICPETGMSSSEYETSFVEGWNSKAKDGNRWEDNPFVFVYSFEKIEL